MEKGVKNFTVPPQYRSNNTKSLVYVAIRKRINTLGEMAWGRMSGAGGASDRLAQRLSAACPRLHPSPLGFTPSLHLSSPGSLGTHSGYPAPTDRWRAQLGPLPCFPTSLTSKRPTMPLMQFSGTLNGHVEYSSDVQLHLTMMGIPWHFPSFLFRPFTIMSLTPGVWGAGVSI